MRAPGPEPIAVWKAIERRQLCQTAEYWTITQADHARLAGQIAAALPKNWMPVAAGIVIQATAVHDDGWRAFDEPALAETGGARPASFIEMAPSDFLRAWAGSIEAAAQHSPLAAILVSRHFCRILRDRMQTKPPSAEEAALMQAFLDQEATREAQHAQAFHACGDAIDHAVDVLQFCDLVSLYVCCGAMERVEFPQTFDAGSIQMSDLGEGAFTFEPSPLVKPLSLEIPAQRWPSGTRATIPIAIR